MTGFKSFASRTIADFQTGVMSLVGPNGCGKTNIVDAIRWVLGEQRSGTLRADRMDDLIFKGTKARRLLGMAEVTLAIDNDTGILHSPFSEIEITRRLYRSGESEYLINRTTSRLRDIQDLFSDTGFGHNAYSIIELAMVEGIISGSSEARRGLIDEAAGVSKFKSAKASTEKRLQSTKENLARLDDVFGELEKRYRSLKRQASRAARYQGLARSLELRLIIDLAEERADIQNTRDPLEKELTGIVRQIDDAENRMETAAGRIEKLQDGELLLIDKINRSQNSLKNYERRESELSSELALARQQLEHVNINLASREKRISALKSTIVEIDSEISDSRNQLQTLTSDLEAAQNLQSDIEQDYRAAREAYNRLTDHIKTLRAEEDKALTKLSNYNDAVKEQEFQTAGSAAKIKSISEDRTAVTQQAEAASAKLKDHREDLETVSRKIQICSDDVQDKIENLSDAREKHSQALVRKAQLKSQVASTEELLAAHKKRAGLTFSLPQVLAKIIDSENLLTVANRIKCEEKFRGALAAGLRPVLDAVDIHGAKSTFELISKFEDSENAVIRLSSEVEFHEIKIKMPDIEENYWRASDLVLNQGNLGSFIKNRLCNLVIVSDASVMQKLISFAVNANLRIATLNGDLFEPDGVIYAGDIDSELIQIGWEDKNAALIAELKNDRNNLEDAEYRSQSAESRVGKADADLTEVRGHLSALESEAASINTRIAGEETLIRQSESRITAISKEIQELNVKLSNFSEIENPAEIREQLQNEVTRTKLDRQSGLKKYHSTEHERIITAEKRASIFGEISASKEKLNGFRSKLSTLKEGRSKFNAESVEFDRQVNQSGKEIERIHKAIESLELQLKTNRSECKKIRKTLSECGFDRDNMAVQRREINADITAAREEQKELFNKRSHIEGELIGLRERLREVDRRLLEDVQIAPSTVSRHTVANAFTEMEEIGYSELSAEKLRTRVNSLGPVNMLALEELSTVEERYHFMSNQRKDLTKGIEVLEETIDRINSEARRRFRKTFDIVNLNFQELFRTLFDGGEARITLEGSDPLSADIRIWTALHGKKLQSLSMLSGGEKALTAIALLFGIYKVRPSPFCILDEVDAPLDDTNITRFNQLVKQFSVNTQFMIVTHNKRTMEAAESLIGVTLKDDGTSQLVTVKLEKLGNDD